MKPIDGLSSGIQSLYAVLKGEKSLRVWLFLAIDVTLLAVCFFHIPYFYERAQAPFSVTRQNDRVVVNQILVPAECGSLQIGDEISAWKDHPVPIPEVIEFLADLSSVGDNVSIKYETSGNSYSTTVTLIPFDVALRFVLITFFVGIIIWSIGIFVLLSRPNDLMGGVIHWASIAMGVSVMITWGAISPTSSETYISRTVFFVSYAAAMSAFFFFTTMYPKPKPGSVPLKAIVAFGPVIAVTLIMTYYHLRAIYSSSVDDYVAFQSSFNIFHVALLAYAIGGILNIILSYKTTTSVEERTRLKWIIWGTSIGLAPFLLLNVLPQLFSIRGLAPEEYSTIFFLAVPFSFAVSFVRYRLLDIDLIIDRTVVYGVFTTFILAVSFLAALLMSSLIGGYEKFREYLLIVASTFIIALMFNPAQRKIQRLIDERLFTARTGFRRAIKEIGEDLRNSLSSGELFQRLADGFCRMIPSGKGAIYRYVGGKLALQEARGETTRIEFDFSPEEAAALASHALVYALHAVVDYHAGEVGYSQDDLLRELGFSVCVPLTTESKELLGAVFFSPRLLGERFRAEEIDLLISVCAQASETLERLLLQERVFLEQEEKKQLKELSDLKSYFVSSVSHELRIPLTAIKIFAETLRTGRVKNERERKNYLSIIEGESERLSRLIGNILDFAKIEQGLKTYTFSPIRLDEIIHRAVSTMRYEFEKEGATLQLKISKNLPIIDGDADALEQVVINLLSNALKYSTTRKEVTLKLARSANDVTVEVTDKGIGISESELAEIFEAFYQVRDKRVQQVGGAGLGLSLVKHIVESHHGTISVRSVVGKGSRFTIRLPLSQKQTEGNI